MSTQANIGVKFFFPDKGITLKERNRLKLYLGTLFKKEGKRVDFLNYIFCSDQNLLEINRNYLNHDFYTDIISFDLSDKSKNLKAEIYISVDRVRENAETLGLSLKSELHRVIFHGALHLCGYGDKTKREKEKMREKEDYYLSRYK